MLLREGQRVGGRLVFGQGVERLTMGFLWDRARRARATKTAVTKSVGQGKECLGSRMDVAVDVLLRQGGRFCRAHDEDSSPVRD